MSALLKSEDACSIQIAQSCIWNQSELDEEIKLALLSWVGDSKLKSKDGLPGVFYHGTNSRFKAFDGDFTGSGNPAGKYISDGFYFCDNAKDASLYGEHILPVYLRMDNPINFTWQSFEEMFPFLAEHFKANLLGAHFIKELVLESGYDGIITEAPHPKATGKELIVFCPTQIKSVDNVGTFDLRFSDFYQ